MILVLFNFDFPTEMMGDALTLGTKDLEENINNDPSFRYKTWIENSDIAESGGIYIFKDMISAQNYANMHKERVEKIGAKNISAKFFHINEPLSEINKGI